MFTTFKLRLAQWGQGLLKGSILGGAITAKAFLGTNALAAMGVPSVAHSVKQAGAVFLVGVVYHAVDYVSANPLPDLPVDLPPPQAPPPAAPKS